MSFDRTTLRTMMRRFGRLRRRGVPLWKSVDRAVQLRNVLERRSRYGTPNNRFETAMRAAVALQWERRYGHALQDEDWTCIRAAYEVCDPACGWVDAMDAAVTAVRAAEQAAVPGLDPPALLAELISQAIHACSCGDGDGTVLCIPEDAAQSVLEHLGRAGVRVILPETAADAC